MLKFKNNLKLVGLLLNNNLTQIIFQSNNLTEFSINLNSAKGLKFPKSIQNLSQNKR